MSLRNPAARAAREFASAIYNHRAGGHPVTTFGENFMPRASQRTGTIKIMGDKSPKSNQKKSSQKQAKTSSANQKKNAAVAAQSATGKKK